MTAPSPGFRAQLEALRLAFVRELSDRVTELEATWNESALPEAVRRERIRQLAHRLTGSAGTFGFTDVADAARHVEVGARPASPEPSTALDDRLARLRQVAEALASQPTPNTPSPGGPAVGAPSVASEIYLLYPEPGGADWALQLATFGFACRAFHDLGTFFRGVEEHRPAVAILDEDALPGPPASPGTLLDFQNRLDHPVPLIMLSNWPDLESRIAAVRAGCRAYLPKPPDLLTLVEAVEAHSQIVPPEPLRVLVVEDDPLQSRHHAAVLSEAGLEVVEVNDPLRVMQPLVDGRPDLVLMDVYMPHCTGVELATAIRQQEAFVGIPIVFLSQEGLRSFQLAALRHGGDDFLTKPVDPEHLVSIVITRGQRGRILRSHMVRDSLTGLLNHSSILDRLATELARASRNQEPLSFAMLDLDCFKEVNDTFGHAAGDRVLRSLARLLQQRLRKTDLVGRYGGEEFAVVLPGATSAVAGSILDAIRKDFAALEFTFGETRTRLTFSAGVAEFPVQPTAELLAAASDEALYRAKHEGRNRVVAP